MLSPSFKDKPDAVVTGDHQCGPRGIAGELRCREAVGTGEVQLLEHLAEGLLLHGQCAPLGPMASWLLGGCFWQQASVAKLLAVFFPLLSVCSSTKAVFLQTCTFPSISSGVGVRGQGGVCRSGCECCAAPALGLSLFSLQLWPE